MIIRYFLSALIVAPVALHAMEKQIPFEEKMTEFTFVNESDFGVPLSQSLWSNPSPASDHANRMFVSPLLSPLPPESDLNRMQGAAAFAQLLNQSQMNGAMPNVQSAIQSKHEYICGINGCEFSAPGSNNIKEHRYTHLASNPRPYRCSVCKKPLFNDIESKIHFHTAHDVKAKLESTVLSSADMIVINAKIEKRVFQGNIQWHGEKKFAYLNNCQLFKWNKTDVAAEPEGDLNKECQQISFDNNNLSKGEKAPIILVDEGNYVPKPKAKSKRSLPKEKRFAPYVSSFKLKNTGSGQGSSDIMKAIADLDRAIVSSVSSEAGLDKSSGSACLNQPKTGEDMFIEEKPVQIASVASSNLNAQLSQKKWDDEQGFHYLLPKTNVAAHDKQAQFKSVLPSPAAMKVIDATVKRKATEEPASQWHGSKVPRIRNENFNHNQLEENSHLLATSVSASTIDSQKSENDSFDQLDPLDELELSEAQIDQYVQNFLCDRSE